MSRSVASVLLAAAFASLAAVGLGVSGMAAEADDTPAPQDAVATPTPLLLGAPTSGLEPRAVVPERDLHVAAADDPEPADEAAEAPAPRSQAGTGVLLAASGTSQDPVDRGGRVVRFSVEVEQGTGLDPDATAAIVEEALYDERSWARDHDLRRVAPAEAAVRVVIASPSSVDAICARAGLNTGGWLSCWSGRTAAINLDRWQWGVGHVPDLAQYRRYVVNHEVGHGLGHGHRDCPGEGRLAPLMQQQTKTLSGCVANEWAFPE